MVVLFEEILCGIKEELEKTYFFWLCSYFNIYGIQKQVKMFGNYNHIKKSIKFHLNYIVFKKTSFPPVTISKHIFKSFFKITTYTEGKLENTERSKESKSTKRVDLKSHHKKETVSIVIVVNTRVIITLQFIKVSN